MSQDFTIPLDKSLFEEVFSHLSKRDFKVVYFVYSKIVAINTDICSFASVTPKQLNSIISKTESIDVMRATDGSLVYVPSKKVINLRFVCESCNFYSPASHRQCTILDQDFSSEGLAQCKNEYYLKARRAYGMLKDSGYVKCASQIELKHTSVKDYNINDHTKYAKELYYSKVSSVDKLNNSILRNYVAKAVKKFRVDFGVESGNVSFVKYIDKFDMMKDKNIFTYLSSKCVIKYINSLSEIEVCDRYKIRCPYFVEGSCRVSQGGEKCTKELRATINEKYN